MKNTGGPAFPWTDPETTTGLPPISFGMTLRDYFAGRALLMLRPELQIMVSVPADANDLKVQEELVKTVLAKAAYMVADAMLAEREKEESK